MVKSIIFYGLNESVKIYSINQKVYESIRVYENDFVSKNFCPNVSNACLSVEIGFNCLNNYLTKYFLESQNIETHSDVGTDRLIKTINYVLEHLKNSNTFYKYKIMFQYDNPVSTKLIDVKLSQFCINSFVSAKYIVETYRGKKVWGEDKIRKFEITFKL
jgi:hypothetical protein